MNWEHAQQDLELFEYFKYVIKNPEKTNKYFNPSFCPKNQTMKIFQHIIGMELSYIIPIGVVGHTQLPSVLTKAILIPLSG